MEEKKCSVHVKLKKTTPTYHKSTTSRLRAKSWVAVGLSWAVGAASLSPSPC